MTNDRVDDWWQDLKDLVAAEKALKVIPYVRVAIDSDHGRLYVYEVPREMEKRWKWLFEWREAKFICQYPKDHVHLTYGYFDKHSGLALGINACLSSLIARKAQITKTQRVIDNYIQYAKWNDIFFDEATDIKLMKARLKLLEKIKNYQDAEEILKQKVKEANDPAKRWDFEENHNKEEAVLPITQLTA